MFLNVLIFFFFFFFFSNNNNRNPIALWVIKTKSGIKYKLKTCNQILWFICSRWKGQNLTHIKLKKKWQSWASRGRGYDLSRLDYPCRVTPDSQLFQFILFIHFYSKKKKKKNTHTLKFWEFYSIMIKWYDKVFCKLKMFSYSNGDANIAFE